MILKEIIPTTIFSVKLMHDCIVGLVIDLAKLLYFHVVLQYIGIVQKKLILLALEENNQASLIVSSKNYNIS